MLLSDLHVHTIKSGHALNTLDECIAKATELGLRYVGISDHAPSMKGAPHMEYFKVLPRLPKQDKTVKILYGCEANILNTNGDIDIQESVCSRLNYVSAGIHNLTPYSGVGVNDNTLATINAIKSGKIDIITHPYREDFPVNIREVVLCAKRQDVALELNKFVFMSAVRERNYNLIHNLQNMMDIIAETQAKCILGSDAHHVSEMGVSQCEWNLLCANYNFSGVELSNGDITLLEKMWNSTEVI